MKRTKHPSGWWNDKDHCIEEFKKWKTLNALRENQGGCLISIHRHGWKEECYRYLELGDQSHATKRPNKRPAGWWNDLQHCIDACKECRNTKELHKKYGGCQLSIRKHGWQEKCYQYMSVRVKEYTYEQLQEIALKYSTYKEFREKDLGAYEGARKRGVLEEICSHMPNLRKINVYDDKPDYKSCQQHALRFSSRSEFEKKDNRYYTYARKHGILDEICAQMLRRGNKKKRCIYVAEFDDNSAYIGLTYFAERRWSDHMRTKNSAVNKHVEETGLAPKWKRLTDYMDYQEASIQEGVWKNKYASEGWTILNKAKTGSLGGGEGYTLEEVLKEASKYNTLPDFFRGSPGHYQRAYRNGWMKDIRRICHSKWKGGFTEAELREIFSEYDSIVKLRQHRHAAIDAANKLGILEDLTKDYLVKPKKHYKVERFTEQELYNIAKQYKYRSVFNKANPKAYQSAIRKGILDKVCAHMKKMPRSRIELTEDEIRAEALKYYKRSDFLNKSGVAAKRAQELGIYEKVCAHMKNPHWKYSKEEAFAIAKHYCNRTELYNENKAAYNLLKFYNLLDSIYPKGDVYNRKWTDEARREAAAQCKTRTEFKKRFPQAMDVTRVKKDWDIIAPHLKPLTRRLSEEQMAEICCNVSNMKELKEYDYKLWYNCSKHPDRRRIAEKYFKKALR